MVYLYLYLIDSPFCQVSEDQHVLDFVTTQCSVWMDQETIVNSSNMDTSFSVNINGTNGIQPKPFVTYQNVVLRDLENQFEAHVLPHQH